MSKGTGHFADIADIFHNMALRKVGGQHTHFELVSVCLTLFAPNCIPHEVQDKVALIWLALLHKEWLLPLGKVPIF
eukprot:2029712-Ditylum_brightwellii.AAC.1